MKQTEKSFSRYLIILSGLLATLGSVGFARFGYSMILPGMKDGLMLTYTQMGLMASGNFLGYIAFAILGAILASRCGPRIVITVSLGLVGTSMLLTGFIETFPQALILRGLTGIGSGGANLPALMLPAIWFSTRRGLATGLILSGNGVGIIVTGLLVPILNDLFGSNGWRYSWLILGAMTIAFTFFCGITIKNPVVKSTSTRGHVKALKWRLTDMDPMLWRIGLVYFLFGLSYIIYVTFFGAYLIKEVGLSSQETGVLWALIGTLSLFSGPLWGHASDRIGRGYSLAFVYFIQSLSFFLFALSARAFTVEAIYASAILFGVSAWSVPSIVAAYSGDYFGPKIAFSAMGFLTLFFGVGQIFGPFIAGYLADLTKTFASSFLLSSLMATLGGILSLKMLRKY